MRSRRFQIEKLDSKVSIFCLFFLAQEFDIQSAIPISILLSNLQVLKVALRGSKDRGDVPTCSRLLSNERDPVRKVPAWTFPNGRSRKNIIQEISDYKREGIFYLLQVLFTLSSLFFLTS